MSMACVVEPDGDGRDDDMVMIRQFLADMEKEPDPEPESEAERPAAPEEPRGPVRARDEDDAESDDPTTDGVDSEIEADGVLEGRFVGGRYIPGEFDRDRLLRAHEERVKKYLKKKTRREDKGGTALTGTTLVSIVAVTMVALYVLHPQIVAASPEMAGVMDDYVATVDHFRAEAGEWRDWLVERVGKLAK